MSLLFQPRDVDFDALLRKKYSKAYIQKHKWKYYHLFTIILKKHLYRKSKDQHNKWHKVSSSVLRNLYGRSGKRGCAKWVHRLIRDDFQQWKVVIHHTEQVEENKRISRYKILDERLLAGFRVVDTVIPQRHILPKIVPTKYMGVHGLIQRAAARLKINHNSALAFIERSFAQSLKLKDKPIDWRGIKKGNWHLFRNRTVGVDVYSRWLWHLHKLDRGSYGFKVDTDNTNRVFYLLTQIPSHLRPFTLLGGKRMVEVDVTACQPLLFTNMVLEYCRHQGMNTIPLDVLAWKSLCEEPNPKKNLYPELYKLMVSAALKLDSDLTYDPVTRVSKRVRYSSKLFKVEFFAKIFFAEEKDIPMRREFAAKFPTVSAAITYYKKEGYRNLAISLQRMEADLIINKVCTQLYSQKISALPVHDALYVHEEHAVVAANEIKRAFLEINLNAQIKIERPLSQ